MPRKKKVARLRVAAVRRFEEGDIGVLPPLGVYDPLGLIQTKDMRRFEEMEIKHGRFAMAATLHVLVTVAGFRFPGYLSPPTRKGQRSCSPRPSRHEAERIENVTLCTSSHDRSVQSR